MPDLPNDAAVAAARVLVIDADPAVAGLIDAWLRPCGFTVVACNAASAPCQATGRFAVVIVDLPTPREGAGERVQRIACDHPATPVMALSSQFFPGVARNGGVARALGVACVLAKPLSRDTLVHAVQSLARA